MSEQIDEVVRGLNGLGGARFTEISAAVSNPLTVKPTPGRELLRVTLDGTVVIADDLTLDEARWAMTQMAQVCMRGYRHEAWGPTYTTQQLNAVKAALDSLHGEDG